MSRSSHYRLGLLFWGPLPFLVALIVVLPFAVSRTPIALMTAAAVELFCILMLLGLYDPARFWWAWRGVAGLVFLACAIYLTATLIESGGKLTIPRRKSGLHPVGAIFAMLTFGLPALWYTLLERSTLRPDDPVDESTFSEYDEMGDEARIRHILGEETDSP